MPEPSAFLHFSEHTLQEVALLFMATVYIIRIIWFLRFAAGKERQAPTAPQGSTPTRSILYSWANVALPGAMESTRSKLHLWIQFVIFHLGVTAAILLSFIIPYGPGLLESGAVVLAIQVITGAACLVGVIRMIRRVGSPYMRAISSPDDYFSLLLLTVWLGSAVLAAPNSIASGEGYLLAFFLLTAFFLVYVPFSKISHYLYYPFTRYYLGKTLGYRGVYPIKHDRRQPNPAS
jgi:nitrate reductase gamma subunit